MSAVAPSSKQEVSITTVVVSAVIVSAIGACLGFLFLTSYTPKPFKSTADLQAYLDKQTTSKLSHHTYFEGRVSRTRSWELKRHALLNDSNTTIDLSVGEINAWMSAKFRRPSLASRGEDLGNLLVVPGVPNIFIDADQGLFFNLPTDISIYGREYDCILIAQGHLTEGPDIGLQIDTLRLNAARIPILGGLGHQLLTTLLKGHTQSDEFVAFKNAWDKVESVEVIADTVRLKLR
jgi:hypothetical protein